MSFRLSPITVDNIVKTLQQQSFQNEPQYETLRQILNDRHTVAKIEIINGQSFLRATDSTGCDVLCIRWRRKFEQK